MGRLLFHSRYEIGIGLVETSVAGPLPRTSCGRSRSGGQAALPVAAWFDRQKAEVLIAIGSDFRDFLNLAGCIALSPERLA